VNIVGAFLLGSGMADIFFAAFGLDVLGGWPAAAVKLAVSAICYAIAYHRARREFVDTVKRIYESPVGE
jgi:hypothetical protein